MPAHMPCLECGHKDTIVRDTRTADEGRGIRRKRVCTECGSAVFTIERTEEEHVDFKSNCEHYRVSLVDAVMDAAQKVAIRYGVVFEENDNGNKE